MNHRKAAFAVLVPIVLSFAAFAQIDDATKQLSHDILKELIEINTTDSVGSVTAAAEAMAKRLRDAGLSRERRAGARTQRPQEEHGGAPARHRASTSRCC